MTLNEATDYFQKLIAETVKNSEIRVYEKFNHIITGLKSRSFSQEQIHSIERELDALNLTAISKNRIKYLENARGKFEKYLKDTFSLISKGYYTNMGIGLGMSIGILFGIIFLSRLERSLGIVLGLSIGMVAGLMIGRSIESKAKAAGRII